MADRRSELAEVWIFTDGSPGKRGVGRGSAAAVVMDHHGEIVIETARVLTQEPTTNQAEYQGLLLGISLARLLGVSKAHLVMDSLLVVEQVKGNFAALDVDLVILKARVQVALRGCPEWTLEHVRREGNRRADWLGREVLR